MKIKILIVFFLLVILISCAPKTVPMTPTPKGADDNAPKVMTSELAEGLNLYENNCAKCHKLYDVHEFSSNEWKPIVKRMQKKAHLDDVQGLKIYNYVTMK